MNDDTTHLLTAIHDIFWTIMDLLDPTSLAFCRQVSKRWHALVRDRPTAQYRIRPMYKVELLLMSPTLLEWGWKHAPLRVRRKFCKIAAARGDLQSLQWLRTERDAPWDEDVCAAAALGGHLDVLQWARKSGASWNAKVLQNAAKGGHFAAFRWARRERAPWDGKVLRAAAKHGRFEIFRWCFRHRAPTMDPMERFASYFAAAGCLEAVRWLSEGELIDNTREMFIELLGSAAAGGHLQILRWLLDTNLVVLDEVAVERVHGDAAMNGRLAVLQWMQRHGYPLTQYVCEKAALGGHLECLCWAVAQARAMGLFEAAALSPDVQVYAARSGNLPLLRWVRAQGAPWTSLVYSAAVDSGDTELLQWLLDHQLPQAYDYDYSLRFEALEAAQNENTCVEAARNGKLSILEWAVAHGAIITTRRVGALAAKGGHLDIIKWLHARNAPLAWDIVVEYAAAEGHLSVVRWAVANGAPSEGICGAAMSGEGRLEVLRWAVDEAKLKHCGEDHPMFYGSLETLVWAHTRGFRIDSNRAFLEGAKGDDKEILGWAARTFGPPDDDLYKLALETRAVDFLDRLRLHGVEWAPGAESASIPNGPEQAWIRAIDSPWADSEAPTDGDETSSLSDEEEVGMYPRPTQAYYESLSSGCEESEDGEDGVGPSKSPDTPGLKRGSNSRQQSCSELALQTDLIETIRLCKFTGLGGFSDGSLVAFLDGEIVIADSSTAELFGAARAAPETADALGDPENAKEPEAEVAKDIRKNLWPDSDDEDCPNPSPK